MGINNARCPGPTKIDMSFAFHSSRYYIWIWLEMAWELKIAACMSQP